MKKALILLLITGVLMLGTFSVIEEISEENSCGNHVDFSDASFGDGHGDPTPDGEGGAGSGSGDVPG